MTHARTLGPVTCLNVRVTRTNPTVSGIVDAISLVNYFSSQYVGNLFADING